MQASVLNYGCVSEYITSRLELTEKGTAATPGHEAHVEMSAVKCSKQEKERSMGIYSMLLIFFLVDCSCKILGLFLGYRQTFVALKIREY